MARFRFHRTGKALYHTSPGFVADVWLSKDNKSRWFLLSKALNELREKNKDLDIHSVVLMGTHLHLLFSCLRLNEKFFIENFHQQLQKELAQGPLDVLERPFPVEHITSYQQLLNTYRYIYRNPVEAGLSKTVENYPFSTLKELLGRQPNLMASSDLLHVIQNPIQVLMWLNAKETPRLHGSLNGQS